MAGDWIQITHALSRKPEVLKLSKKLSVNKREVVGTLVDLWTWFDQNTLDGVAKDMLAEDLLGDIVGSEHGSAWADALEEVGWLTRLPNGCSIPKFDRYISYTAKDRALGRIRKAKQRNGTSDLPPWEVTNST